MLWLLLALTAMAHDGALPCGTPELYEAPDYRVEPPVVFALDRQQRDAYGAPNVLLGKHVAVRWGDDTRLTEADLKEVVDIFETAWEVEFGQMGHAEPHRSDEFYFNVYIGDTGEEVPPGKGYGGYYTRDVEGWPMIVIAEGTLSGWDYRSTLAHELYHAVQGASGLYRHGAHRAGHWYWEATANWAVQVVYPDNDSHARLLYGYALFPHFRLDFYDRPDEGKVEEYYQYGAFVFAVHVQEVTGEWEIIRDSWVDDRGTEDPIETLRILLDERGYDFEEVWLDHLARNVTWDYPRGELYRQIVWSITGASEYAGPFAGALQRFGHDDCRPVAFDMLPRQYGSNVLRLEVPADGTYTFELRGEPTNEVGHDAFFGARLVVVRPDGAVEYVPFEFVDHEASVDLTVDGDVHRAYIAVGAWTDAWISPHSQERFPYAYRVRFDGMRTATVPEPGPEPRDPERPSSLSGCGCASGGAGVPWLLGLLGLVLVGRRRR